MTKQIGTTIVPDDLYNFAKMLCDKGGKVFLSMMAKDHTGAYPDSGCTNCNGSGHIMLEYYVTAPMDHPVIVQPNRDGFPDKNPTTAVWDAKRESWYGKKMKSYRCPVCAIAQPKATAPVNL